MTVITKPIGRLPINKGNWDANFVNPKTGIAGYGKKFRAIRYGCELESKIENNTYDPITWDGAEDFTIDTTHWMLVSGNPLNWLAGLDKPATTGTTGAYPYNGLGRIVLKKNIVDGVNTLTHEAFEDSEGNDRENTIYVIQYDFVLGEDITVPANCVLEFDGGSISGAYTITGNNTCINAGLVKIFNTDVTLAGSWNVTEIYPEWFGAKGDGVTDDALAIQAAVDNAMLAKSGICKVTLLYHHVYYTSNPINIPSFMRFGGNYTCIDSLNDDERPTIKVNGTDGLIICGHNYGQSSPSRIYLHDLCIIGSSPNSNSGISLSNNSSGLSSVSIDGIRFSNFKFGINLRGSGDVYCTKIRNIATDIRSQVGIGIYLKFTRGIYKLDVSDCNIHDTYIGGMYVETNSMSGPLNIVNTYFEGCGTNYNLDDLYEYGVWGLRLNIAQRHGIVNVDNCYFERNFTQRPNDGILHNDNPYGFIEAVGEYISDNVTIQEIYVTNPNFKNTSEVVIHGEELKVNVTHTHFSTLCQTVSIVDKGILSFVDNNIYSPGGTLGIRQKSIVKIFDETTYRSCVYIGVHIQKLNASRDSKKYNNESALTQSIELVHTDVAGNSYQLTTSQAVIDINDVTLKEKFHYDSVSEDVHYGNPGVVYIDPNAPNGGNGSIADPFNSFTQAMARLASSKTKAEITFVLLDDITISNAVTFISGLKYNFVSHGISNKKINVSSSMFFFNSDVYIDNIDIDFITNYMALTNVTNTSLTLVKCNVSYNAVSTGGLCISSGITKLGLKSCVLTRSDPSDASAINRKSNGLIFTTVNDCTNTTNIPFVDDSNRNFDSIPVSNS